MAVTRRVLPLGLVAAFVASNAVVAAAAPPPDAEARLTRYLHAGRFRDAAVVVESWRGTSPTPRERDQVRDLAALVVIASRDWRVQIDPSSVPAPADWSPLTNHEVTELGLRAARAAWPGGRPDALTVAHAAADVLEARGTVLTRYLQAILYAAIAAAQEERDLMALSFQQAAALEAQLAPAGQPPAPLRADRIAGDLWLQVHRYADAREASARALAVDHGDARSTLALARAHAKLGARADSAAAYRRLLELWAHADPDRPELAEAREGAVTPRSGR